MFDSPICSKFHAKHIKSIKLTSRHCFIFRKPKRSPNFCFTQSKIPCEWGTPGVSCWNKTTGFLKRNPLEIWDFNNLCLHMMPDSKFQINGFFSCHPPKKKLYAVIEWLTQFKKSNRTISNICTGRKIEFGSSSPRISRQKISPKKNLSTKTTTARNSVSSYTKNNTRRLAKTVAPIRHATSEAIRSVQLPTFVMHVEAIIVGRHLSKPKTSRLCWKLRSAVQDVQMLRLIWTLKGICVNSGFLESSPWLKKQVWDE